MAIAVGTVVGFAIRLFGKEGGPLMGLGGAVLSLLGCVLGNLLSALMFYSNAQGIPLGDLLGRVDFDAATQLLSDTFHPMDLLFYGIAIYLGFRLGGEPKEEE